ncbi:hypothetical protein BJX66DRAFT_336262 [Aspergillus keveii]|uniref:NACHT domain-containing protein n=1 Tax=Aspergillus keveii TaxID=714993 RepID=A0ABR4GB57_9EURO
MADEPRYSTQGAYGLKKCHDSKSAIVDIIFVHGLTGNRETTWTDRDTKVFWPETLLPNDIPDARILTFGYDADIVHFLSTASQNRIGNHAQNFINVLSQLREKSETALLSSKNSAEGHLQHIVECTVGITFLGTPHCGSNLANWAKVFGRVITMFKRTNTRLLETLSPDSEVLAWIQKDFHTMLRSRQQEGKQPLRITCFYEELPIHGIGEIVPMHSAILPSYNSIGIRKNHMDMAKFSDEEDPGYLAVSTEIWRWVKDIKSQRQLVQSSEGPNVEALNRQQYYPQYPAAMNTLQPGQRALPQSNEAAISPFEACMAQFGPRFFQPGYSGTAPVFQGGNTVSGQTVSGHGKVVQGNNMRAEGDMTFYATATATATPMQGGNQVSDTFVASGGFAIVGNNLSAAGNITINAGPSSEKKCLQALFATDPADDRAKHISFKGNPVRSIFTWITDGKAYKTWVDRGTGSRLLWISGGPGMGKTMLAIFLSEELKQIADDNGLVLYYFCEGRDPKRNCTINILRGLIYTLVQQRPALIKHLLPDYEVRSDALFETEAIEPLWRILINMIRDPTTGPVYCIIDGIDECASTSLTHLEHILKKLAGFYHLQITRKPSGDDHEACKAEATSPEHLPSQHDDIQASPHTPPPVFKVALVSREEPECLPRELSEFERVQLRKPGQTPIESTEPTIDGNIEDSSPGVTVPGSPGAGSPPPSPAPAEPPDSCGYACSLDLYIRTKVDELVRSKRFDDSYGDLLKDQLAARGDGTFLWVDTAVDQLSENASQYSGPDLCTLPSRTDALYCLGLLEAPARMASTIGFVLRWATVAFRPLTIGELSAVVYFVNGQPNGPEIQEVQSAIGVCRSLLDVSENGEVKLAHQSTKAFLTDLDSPLVENPRTQQFHVDEDMTHAEIASVSIAYVERSPFHQCWWHLASIDVGTTHEETVIPNPDLLAQYPFIQYSSLYWPDHLNRAPQGLVNLKSPLFSPGSEIRRNWFQSVWEVIQRRDASLTPGNMSLLHIAAYFDLQELAEVLSRREPPDRFRARIEKINFDFMTPLFTAADRGSPRVFAFLLDHGACQKSTALKEDILQFTSRKGRMELVEILISRGAEPNHFMFENIGDKTASLALRHAPRKLKDFVINAGYREDRDINELIKVDHGANMSPLQCAVCCGHEEVARVLLQCGANVHYTTTAGWTAMHFAAEPSTSTVSYPLQNSSKGLDVDYQYSEAVVKPLQEQDTVQSYHIAVHRLEGNSVADPVIHSAPPVHYHDYTPPPLPPRPQRLSKSSYQQSVTSTQHHLETHDLKQSEWEAARYIC